MKIITCTGFECEKALPTTVEDQFNQSEVEYEQDGKQRSFTVIYVRYFDEYVSEKGIYNSEEAGVPFYNIVALLILLKQKDKQLGSRIYFNNTERFLKAFNLDDISEALSIYQQVLNTKNKPLMSS